MSAVIGHRCSLPADRHSNDAELLDSHLSIEFEGDALPTRNYRKKGCGIARMSHYRLARHCDEPNDYVLCGKPDMQGLRHSSQDESS